MTVIVCSIIAAWILFSAILVTVLCMNSSRLSRIDEPFKPPKYDWYGDVPEPHNHDGDHL
jgi:hypothetical protein